MPRKLRPTGLGPRIDKDRYNYTVFSGGWEIGRIYEYSWQSREPPLVLVDERQRTNDTSLRSFFLEFAEQIIAEHPACPALWRHNLRPSVTLHGDHRRHKHGCSLI